MQIIDGRLVAQKTKEQIKDEVIKIGGEIGLAVVLVGDNPASLVYVRNKVNACAEVGINSYLHNLDKNASKDDILSLIKKLNEDKNVHGIMVQLPLPKGIDEYEILNSITPEKDVDGCHFIQKGLLWTGKPDLIPCTPYGIMKLLNFYNIEISGKNAVIIGRSNLVGKPLAELLLSRNATVTICHSKTKDLALFTKQADILCVAIGKPNAVNGAMIKEGAIIVDVGINRVDGRLFGDVDFQAVKEKCSYITPVPGGVGPMTVTMLMANTVKAYKNQNRID